MTKQEQIFQKVEAFQKTHPDMNKNQIFKKLKVNSSAYYKHRAATPAKKAKRKYTRQVVRGGDAPATASQVTVIMGTPDQIRAVLQ